MKNTARLAGCLALITLAFGCVGAPDPSEIEEVEQGSHALTYSSVSTITPITVPPLQRVYPSITGFSPASAPAGARVSIRGSFLDRSRLGRVITSGLGYTVSFAGLNGARVAAVNPQRVSATELTATVPTGAATGRVRLSDGLGTIAESPVDFVIPLPPPPPAPTRVRIQNNNQYDIVSLVVNGSLVRGCASPLAPGASVDVNVMPGGFAVGAVLGFCSNGSPESIPPSHLEINGSVSNGQTFTVTANPFTLGELLTNWGFNSGEWASGLYIGGDGAWHQISFRFDPSARWSGFDRGTFWASGQALLVSWPTRAACVQFRIAANAAVTQTCLPFSGFIQDGTNFVRR